MDGNGAQIVASIFGNDGERNRDCHRYSNHLQGSGEIKVCNFFVVHSDKHPRTFRKTGVIS